MASRKLSDACKELQEVIPEFLEQCAEAKIDVLVYCIYRSNEEQDELYKQGRTVEGKKVTNAKGGQSPHNATNPDGSPASRAFDCVPCKQGKPQWNDISSYEKMGEIGRGLALTWGGEFKSIKDRPHFQLDKVYP